MVEPRQSNSNPRLTSIHQLRSVFGKKGRLTLSRGFARRHVWVLPVLALVGLVFAATWLRSRIERAIEEQTEAQLQALLDADVTAVKLWLRSEEANAMAAAEDPDVRKAVVDLLKQYGDGKATPGVLLQAPEREQFATAIKPWIEPFGFVGYLVIDRREVILTATAESLIGQKSIAGYTEFANSVLAGRALSRARSRRCRLFPTSGDA